MFRILALTVFITVPFAACTSSDGIEDDLAIEDNDSNADGKADGSGTYTYFAIDRDQRRCVSPLCGGYFVARVNHTTTRCANGQYAERCYVAELDLKATGLEGLPDERPGQVLIRGSVVAKKFTSFGNLGRFVASEVWHAGAGAGSPDGVFAKVEQTGIRCFAAPCADKVERKLNSSLYANIADLDFDASGATEDELAPAFAALTGDDLIVAGYRYYVHGAAGYAKARTVNQFYTSVRPNTIIEAEDNSQVTRSTGWALFVGDVLHNGEGLESSQNGATLSFTITGAGLTVFHEVGPNRHEFEVAIDGGLISNVDTNAPDFAYQVPSVVASALPYGLHTVTLTCKSTICAIDYFEVAGN